MRVHRLELVGIGPYAAPQALDFDALSSSGLFLLTGPTGAGKTTILDAIVYALYGTVPGARGDGSRSGKATSDRIVSDLRSPNTQPYVELEFTISGRRLRLRRVPQHQRPKSRGDGLTVEKGSVVLSEFADDTWHPRSTDPQEVGTEVKALLGMSAAQFAQVVLLPQGEFAGFLRADDATRRDVLERLFHVDQYKGAQSWFEERAKIARARLEEAQGDLRGLVERLSGALGTAAGAPPAAFQLDAIERWVSERRFSADELHALATIDADAATAARTAAASAIERTELILTRITEHAKRRAALDALQTRLPNARAWIAEHESAELAAHDERWLAAARDAQDQLTRLREREDDAARADGLQRAAANAHAAAETAEQAADAADAELRRLQPLHERAQAAAAAGQVARETLDARIRDRDALAAQHTAAATRDALHAERTAELRRQQHARQSLQEAQAAAHGLPHLHTADADRTAATHALKDAELAAARHTAARDHARGELRRATEQLEQASGLHADLQQATAALHTANAASHQARDAHLSAREARLDAMAAELASSLRDGEHCPVCGSEEHPAPAPPSSGGDLRAAERGAEERARAAEGAAQRAGAVVAEVRGRLAALGESVTIEATCRELRSQLDHHTQQLADLAADVDGRRSAVAHHDGVIEAIHRAAASVADAERQLALIDGQIEVLTSKCEAAAREAGRAPVTADDLAAANDAVNELQERARAAAAANESATQLQHAVEAARNTSSTQRTQAAAQASTARSASQEADAITARLATLIAPHATLAVACDHAARRAQTLSAAADIVAQCIAARAEADAAEHAISDASALDHCGADESSDPTERLAQRRSAANRAEQHREAVAATLRDAARHVNELARASEALAAARATLGPVAEEAERLQRLHETVRGLGDNRRKISLTTYVLAARLEEVADAATLHLQRMSSGRYSLLHHDERFGNGQAGLGLRVLDGYSGEERDTATLSGGEAFYASLALALGLADVVQNEAGGRPLETLLVDEGFGALDADTLEEVLGELDELRAAGRTIGLVSHVPALAERIPAQLRVTASAAGSTARVVIGDRIS